MIVALNRVKTVALARMGLIPINASAKLDIPAIIVKPVTYDFFYVIYGFFNVFSSLIYNFI